MSVRTVETHRAHTVQNVRLDTRAELVMFRAGERRGRRRERVTP